MKYVLSAILIFMVTAGMSYAQTEDVPIKLEMPDKPEKTTKGGHFRAKKYSRMLNSLVVKSSRFISDENQKAELIEIRDEYVFDLAKKENEYKKANSEVLKLLSNADFKASKVKKEFKKTQALQSPIFDEYIQGLSALRKLIGNDNYNSLFTMTEGKDKKPKADSEEKNDKDVSKEEPGKKPAEENAGTE
jgi:hypothetical protein